MKVKSNITKFQMGGAAPSPEEQQMVAEQQMAAQDQGQMGAEQDPLMQIAQVAAEALETQNCEAAFAVCEAFLQLLDQAMGEQSQEAPQEPTFQRKGGKITRRG